MTIQIKRESEHKWSEWRDVGVGTIDVSYATRIKVRAKPAFVPGLYKDKFDERNFQWHEDEPLRERWTRVTVVDSSEDDE